MKQQLTEWFPADVKPVNIGVYERDCNGKKSANRYWYWNGEFFEVGGFDRPEDAVKKIGQKSFARGQWRGLAEKPN